MNLPFQSHAKDLNNVTHLNGNDQSSNLRIVRVELPQYLRNCRGNRWRGYRPRGRVRIRDLRVLVLVTHVEKTTQVMIPTSMPRLQADQLRGLWGSAGPSQSTSFGSWVFSLSVAGKGFFCSISCFWFPSFSSAVLYLTEECPETVLRRNLR